MTRKPHDCEICGEQIEGTDYLVLLHRETGEEHFMCQRCVDKYNEANPGNHLGCECCGH